ncbi:MAG: glycoside hydrolase family protein [Pseudomonadota bacterium]
MRISQRGLDLIKFFEGLKLEAYQDVVGIWTIGYGHTSEAGPPEVIPGMEITEQEAEDILRNDVQPFERAVEAAVKVSINQNMFDALVSITFNIGPGAMRRSTFMRRLNNKDYIGAADALLMWNKAGGQVWRGLQIRRERERALFLEGFNADDTESIDDIRGLPVEESSARRSNLAGSRTMTGAGAAGTAGAAAIGATVMGGGEDEDDDSGADDAATDTDNSGGSDSAADQTGGDETDNTDADPGTPAGGDDDAADGEDGSSRSDLGDGNSDSQDPVDTADDNESGQANGDEDAPADGDPSEDADPADTDTDTPSENETGSDDEDAGTGDTGEAGDGEDETGTMVEQPDGPLFVSAFEGDEASDAVIVGAGTIAILAAIWVAIARFDDWRNHRR